MKLNYLENLLQDEWVDSTAQEASVCKSELAIAMDHHLSMLEEKANMDWIQGSDRNTSIFHAAIKARRDQNRMKLKLEDDSFTEDRNVIGPRAAEHFKALFEQHSSLVDPSILSVLKPCISDMENERLISLPTCEEIKKTIDNMSDKSAPGTDGFTGAFYSHCWDIIKDDLIDAIHAFFQGLQLPRIISSTALVLIPKVKDASKISELRPISLCNFVHKIISKILNDRLLDVLPNIISPEQSGFLPKRSIHESIALAHDLVSELHNDSPRGGNTFIKIDMSKAYDRVSWHFILAIFEALGFHRNWIDMIYRNISNCWYNIRWDGGVYGYFISNQGVRQGDPLSPSLFILAMEVFSRHLNRAVMNNQILPYFSARDAITITHLLYADDMLLFSNGSIVSINNLLALIKAFCHSSGQVLNAEKSSIFLSKTIPEIRKENIIKTTNFSLGTLPTSYLGAPLYCGKTKVVYFDDMVSKVTSRLQGWMTKMVSIGGRLILNQSVLASVPIHSMSALPVPKSVLAKVESHMANFLWDEGTSHRKHWVAWQTACKPKALGGLGFRSLKLTMYGLHAKMASQYILQKSLWSRYMRSKYHGFARKGPLNWRSISSHIPALQHQSIWVFGNGAMTVERVLEVFNAAPNPSIQGLTVAQIVQDNKVESLNLCLPAHARIKPDIFLSRDKDCIAWSYSLKGKFSMKSYLNMNRSLQTSPIHKIWQSWIPPKVSIFAWRLRNRAIATDDRLMDIGFQLASRCQCCSQHQCESIPHLFIHSEAARYVWDYFGPICSKSEGASLSHMFRIWVGDMNPLSQVGCLSIAIFLFAIWELWKHRNKKRHEEKPPDLIQTILYQVHKFTASFRPSTAASYNEQITITTIGVMVKLPISKPIKWVAWNPGNGITVNLEVSSDAKKGSVIFRDRFGAFLCSFVCVVDALCREANLLYLIRKTLSFAQDRQIIIHEIQCPNNDVCEWLGEKSTLPWLWIYEIRRILSKLEDTRVGFISDNLNKCAAKLLHLSPGVYNDLRLLPSAVRGLLRLDAMRFPSLLLDPGE